MFLVIGYGKSEIKLIIKYTAYAIDLDSEHQGSMFWYLWPNTILNMMPDLDELSVFAVRPTGLGCCSFEGHTFTKDGVLNQAGMQYVADVLVPEDIYLCESVQRGLKSFGYNQVPFIL